MAVSEPVEIGRIARARERIWMITDVDVAEGPTTWVTLESLQDDSLGQTLEVLKEREADFEVLPEEWLHDFEQLDTPEVFDSFLYALRWQTQSLLPQETIRAPYFGSVSIREYQLEPVIKALAKPRIHLLLADDVGLGKTIESGMILQELLLSGKIRRILILCPASLRWQWKWEMEEKFGVEFRIIDRKAVADLKKEYGVNVNPWLSFPRLIASFDYLKMETPLQLFKTTQPVPSGAGEAGFQSPFKKWDLLLLDEAHNCIPQPTKNYFCDSDRTRLIRDIAPLFEHRIFLTATPHNGKREAFIAFLELLDPYRFNRYEQHTDSERFKKTLEEVMIRRMKRGPNGVKDPLGKPLFPERAIRALEITSEAEEERMFNLLDRYIQTRLRLSCDASQETKSDQTRSLEFALTILKKRALSSPLAFHRSVEVHQNSVRKESQSFSASYLKQLNRHYSEEQDDDLEKREVEDALIETLSTDHWSEDLDLLYSLSESRKNKPDSKCAALLEWIDAYMKPDSRWNAERVVIFTEFLDTLDYTREQLLTHGINEEQILCLYGGMEDRERETIKSAFESNPERSPVRILLATDAASEGINLQKHCRYMIHLEIPWNPTRLEQRMGRVDRYGQQRDITIFHFVYTNREDSRFLQTIVNKVNQIQEDLQSLNPVIAEEISRRMLGYRSQEDLPLFVNESLVKERIKAKTEVSRFRQRLEETRNKLSLSPENVRMVLNSALRLLRSSELQPTDNPAYEQLTQLPKGWQDLIRALPDGRLPATVTFDESVRENPLEGSLFLHPNHPILKRAMAFFRTNQWSKKIDQKTHSHQSLNRVTVKSVPASVTTHPVFLLYLKGLILNEFGQVLTEEILSMGFTFSEGLLIPIEPGFLSEIERALIRKERPLDELSSVRSLVMSNLKMIHLAVDEQAKSWAAEQIARFEKSTQSEINGLETLIQDRIREIGASIKPLRKFLQTRLFETERSQAEEDARRLLLRQKQLEEEFREIPNIVRKKYAIRGQPRLHPIAYCFAIPE